MAVTIGEAPPQVSTGRVKSRRLPTTYTLYRGDVSLGTSTRRVQRQGPRVHGAPAKPAPQTKGKDAPKSTAKDSEKK